MDAGAIPLACLEGLDDGFLAGPGCFCQFRNGWISSELLDERGRAMPELEVELLHSAACPDGPSLVAEVALELADDRPGGKRGKVHPALGVVAIDRLDQGD